MNSCLARVWLTATSAGDAAKRLDVHPSTVRRWWRALDEDTRDAIAKAALRRHKRLRNRVLREHVRLDVARLQRLLSLASGTPWVLKRTPWVLHNESNVHGKS